MPALALTPIPALADNYIWLLHDGQRALAVDPGDAGPLQQVLDTQGLLLETILVTHHHPDHTAGLGALRSRWPQAQVVGTAHEAIAGVTNRVRGGDTWRACGQTLRVLDVPGHTAGHVAFLIDAPTDGTAPILFCGDTLFAGGCGRIFDGTAAELLNSLQTLGGLPGSTRVCCTHEYTVSNLRFALAMEPDNAALQQRLQGATAQRARREPTLPSSIALEVATNPFLRCHLPALQSAAQRAPQPALGNDPLAVFTALRQWKNVF
jgi:hydroxyacylglutathione hydrolase